MNHPAKDGTGTLGVLPEHVTLYLTTPMDRTERMLREILRRCNVSATEPYPFVLAVPVRGQDLHLLGVQFGSALSPTERQLTKCWLALAGNEPTQAQLMQAQTLDDLISWIDGQWLAELLHERRLVTYFQPIVYNERPWEIYAYECLLRGRAPDEQLIPPDRLYGAARATGMLHSLDAAARLTAVQSVAHRQLDTFIFINFNPRSFSTPERSFQTTFAAAAELGVSAERFVFEVVESEEIEDPQALSIIMDCCRQAGSRVALDDLGAGYSSLNLLTRLKPDFIKLDMSLVRNVDRDPYKSCVAAKLLELAKELGVGTVVEGVETMGEWQWTCDHGADFAQGYLFARPAPTPPLSQFAGAQPA